MISAPPLGTHLIPLSCQTSHEPSRVGNLTEKLKIMFLSFQTPTIEVIIPGEDDDDNDDDGTDEEAMWVRFPFIKMNVCFVQANLHHLGYPSPFESSPYYGISASVLVDLTTSSDMAQALAQSLA